MRLKLRSRGSSSRLRKTVWRAKGYGVPGKTAAEKENLFYAFTVNGDDFFCREGYENAEGVLAHLDNIGALLAELLTMVDLIRFEVHGPAEELEKLKKPLAHLNPAFFAPEESLTR